MISVIIPIKDHSERVPGKNFRDFAGKPLYRWIIDKLVNEVPEIDDIIIDTDSEVLLQNQELISMPKIKLCRRRNDLLGDSTDVNLIIESELQHLKNEIVLQTHVTNPILTSLTINKAINLFKKQQSNHFDSLMSVTTWKKRFFYNGKAVNHDPSKLIKTQDLIPLLEENSNIYIFTKNGFVANNNRRVGKNPLFFEMDSIEALDIDYESDFLIAEAVQKLNLLK